MNYIYKRGKISDNNLIQNVKVRKENGKYILAVESIGSTRRYAKREFTRAEWKEFLIAQLQEL